MTVGFAVRRRVVQIAPNLTLDEHRATFERIMREGLDGIALTIGGSAYGPTWSAHETYDLDFLRLYDGIRTLELFVPLPKSLEPIATVASRLESLAVGELRDPSITLEPIGDCPDLQALSLVRTRRGMEAVEKLRGLRRLSLTGHPADRYEFLRSLESLEALSIAFTSLSGSAFLQQFPKLRTLELLRINKLAELDAVANLDHLEALVLEQVTSLTRLPRLDRLRALKLLVLITLNRLEDVSGLRASTIEELGLVYLPLTADELRVLETMPALARVVVALKKKSDSERAVRALGERAVPTTNELQRYAALLTK